MYEVSIDSEGQENYERLDVFPTIKVCPGKVHKICVNIPSIVAPHKVFVVRLKVVECFQNRIPDFDTNRYSIVVTNLETYDSKTLEQGQREVKLEEGAYEVAVNEGKLEIEKSVLLCDSTSEKLYWGDIHVHSNLTANIRDNDCGASPRQGYLYAKEVAMLDYVAISEQTFKFNDNRSVNIDVETWNRMGEQADKYNEANALVTFPGFELH